MIFVNFKTYSQGTGEEALHLVKILEEVAGEKQIKIIPVVQASDVREISTNTTLEVWVQSINSVEFGAHTGAILPEAVFEDGAIGTFLNHSENKVTNFHDLEASVKRAKDVGLKSLVFAADVSELKKIAKLKPTFL